MWRDSLTVAWLAACLVARMGGSVCWHTEGEVCYPRLLCLLLQKKDYATAIEYIQKAVKLGKHDTFLI